MAANTVKREASTSRPVSAEDAASAQKKTKYEEEQDASDSDSGIDGKAGGAKSGKASNKVKGKRNSETHPHRCNFEGCERAYTRAEHLHRHQLEHKFDSKHFKCPFDDCGFGCVRRDLLDRHIERHNKQGSNLWRRDQKRGAGKGTPRIRAAGGRKSHPDGQLSPGDGGLNANGTYQINGASHLPNAAQPLPISPSTANDYVAGHPSILSPVSPNGNFPVQPLMQPPQSNPMNGFGGSNGMDVDLMPGAFYHSVSNIGPTSYYPPPRSRGQSSSNLPIFEPPNLLSAPGHDIIPNASIDPAAQDVFNFIDGVGQQSNESQMYDFQPWFPTDENGNPVIFDDLSIPNLQSSFYGFAQGRAHPEPEKARRQKGVIEYYQNIPPVDLHDGSSETSMDGPQQTPVRVPTPIHLVLGPDAISSDKHKELFSYIERKFEDVPRPDKIKSREREELYFSGRHFVRDQQLNDRTREYLTQNCLDMYLKSYWDNYAPQIPVIHPSLDPNREDTECLLLLAMMAIGATSVNNQNKKAESEIASFFAWNVRTRVMNHGDLVCPTETWVLQTLVLLEAFEKLFSTRLLHERSHQLHGLTIELARRSECFEGPSTIEMDMNTQKASWKKFVDMESRKRAALTIFMTDAFHACMFAHKDSIRFQEIELAVPCSDSLWERRDDGAFLTAFSVSHEDETNGSTRIKRLLPYGHLHRQLFSAKSQAEFNAILKNSELQQSKFAIKIIIAATISVYREIDKFSSRQNSLILLSRLENWIKKSTVGQSTQSAQEDANLAELYAICATAQINLRSNVVFLQQIACPQRVLGKTVTTLRRSEALKQIRLWVRTSNSVGDSPKKIQAASEAVCAAARFLTYIYASDARVRSHVSVKNYDPVGDYFLHRPWAVYIAILCIWAYAYTQEGPISPSKVTDYKGSHDYRAVAAADRYLTVLMGIETPEQLKATKELNHNLGLLSVIADRLHSCQWELLQEAGDRAVNCASILKQKDFPVEGWQWRSVLSLTQDEKEENKREREDYVKNAAKRAEEYERQANIYRQNLVSMQNKARSVSAGLLKDEGLDSRSESRGP